MNTIAQWEDEDNNRQVQFSIVYSINDSTVVVDEVTPTKVTIIDSETNTTVKTMGVHSVKGKKMLREQFVASGQLEKLSIEIGRRNGLLVSA